jgi:hypothetical protein
MKTINGEYLQCDSCKRKSVSMKNLDLKCEMIQPSKNICEGILKLKKQTNFHKKVIDDLVSRSTWGKVNNNLLLSRMLCFIKPEAFNKIIESMIDYEYRIFTKHYSIETDFDFDKISLDYQISFKKLIHDFYLIFATSFRKVDIVDTLDSVELPTSLGSQNSYTNVDSSANGAMDMVIWEALNTEHDLSIILRTIIANYMMKEYSIKNLRKNILDK